ncbi:MAG: hypothetical protein C5B58_11605 [Acidobacteria bacterium]|nr:MAG: hypothetical protein C5B58_11605 [Acidobacteriota bacterium]
MRELDPGYCLEVDQISKDAWHDAMLGFADAAFYQTWSFGAVHSGEDRLSHVLLKRNGDLVAMAQVRIYKPPGLPLGIAFISWGPMWKLKGQAENTGNLQNVIRGLYNEYAVRRGYFLTILPKIIQNEHTASLGQVFAAEGFSHREDPVQTVVLDLSPSLDELRHYLDRTWRQSLKGAEKQPLVFVEGTDGKVFDLALQLAREMKDRKKYFGGNQEELAEVQKDLPESHKLRILVCLYDGQPISALGWPTIGTVGIPLVGGTGNIATKVKSSHLLWWKMVEYYKARGFSGLDTGGVSQERNPGGFLFKTHLVGKRFEKLDRYIGQFDACENPLSRVLYRTITRTRDAYRRVGRKLSAVAARGSLFASSPHHGHDPRKRIGNG